MSNIFEDPEAVVELKALNPKQTWADANIPKLYCKHCGKEVRLCEFEYSGLNFEHVETGFEGCISISDLVKDD